MLLSIAVVKSFSSKKLYYGPGGGMAHGGRLTKSKINRTYKKKPRGLDEVGPIGARVNMGRTVEEGPV